MTWEVDSFLPIEEYRILYRVNDGNDDSEWTNIIPPIGDGRPAKTYKHSFTYKRHFVFYGLTPSTEYEVIIQSRNREGWSDPNDIFRFGTRASGTRAAAMTQSLTSNLLPFLSARLQSDGVDFT